VPHDIAASPRYTLADFAYSGVLDSVVRALMETGQGPFGLRLNETHITDAALDLSHLDRWLSQLDLSYTQVTNRQPEKVLTAVMSVPCW
jgi:hypothetical protein